MTWASGAGLADFVAENQANTWLACVSSGIVAGTPAWPSAIGLDFRPVIWRR
jgi:hypothetical protein